jgi:hypothetical protein
MKRCTLYIYLLFLIVISSCANRVAPSGGEKDVAPPLLQSAEPPNFSTNMTAKHITLNFDEYVQLKEPSTQIIVSPLMDPAASFDTRKKTVTIDLPDTLRVNTTYTINFGEAIVDAHESNVFGFQYVFSTGAVLDSLSVNGKAVDALTLVGKKGIKVMLYSDKEDSLPFKKKPDYFAITDDNGNYKINNISPGSYMAVASEDKNSNYINDSPREEAISTAKIITVPDSAAVDFAYYTEPSKTLYIKSTTAVTENRWDMIFNRPAEHPSLLIPVTGSGEIITEWSPGNDTLIFWSNENVMDTVAIVISENKIPVDTAVIRLKTRVASTGGRGGAATVPSFVESANTLQGIIAGNDIVITMMRPRVIVDSSKIIFREDSIAVPYRFSFSDSLKRNLHIQYPWKEGKNYLLQFLPGALIDFTGKKNDSLTYNFTARKISETGSVEFEISGIGEGSWILQLVNNEYKPVREIKITEGGKYIFTMLEPQPLKARIIFDENENGRWDAGDYFGKRMPEKVYYYQGELQSRANWEVQAIWNVVSR